MFFHLFRLINLFIVLVVDSNLFAKQHNSAFCETARQAADLLISSKITNLVKTTVEYGIFSQH
tara:strand:+ start:396 stop:584 length:189 start_codon:yes stop_codon:yes gene_type:complete